jgi:hypothetical protein
MSMISVTVGDFKPWAMRRPPIWQDAATLVAPAFHENADVASQGRFARVDAGYDAENGNGATTGDNG